MTDRPPYAIILGTNEIASAVAIRLHHQGYGVVMSHDPLPPSSAARWRSTTRCSMTR
ncbi:hypothetical protein [Nitrospirillum sp. BR 11828]|uniref:hypothetical protein n=1 Tax=Nitrospirillum sp. BR 11828 TaxID=3104325 RepID=UPI002ACA6954|nr:hypothetical protein [Nitrospirillum sp. BR 11828]MDZ5649882.1 hypothetical protein [Nitrospirillum sp. BR 11828]